MKFLAWEMELKICVIGAGAMGGTYGGRLANAGFDVHFVDAWPEHVDAINENGFRLDGVPGDLILKTPASLPDGELPTGCDLAIVSVDSNNTARAAETAERVLAADGYALPIQNGIGNVEILIGRLGAGRVAAGSTMCSAIPIGPGHINQTHEGKTTIGEWDGASSSRLEDLKVALQKAGFSVEITSEIESVIWTKFTLNVAINALCAVTGLRLGEIARLDAMDAFQDKVIDEVLAVVAARNITLQDPDIRRTIKDHCWSKFSKPSMLQHMERGRRTEVDALNGAVASFGKELGIPAPYNDAVAALVKGRELAMQRALFEPDIDYDRMEAEAGPRPDA